MFHCVLFGWDLKLIKKRFSYIFLHSCVCCVWRRKKPKLRNFYFSLSLSRNNNKLKLFPLFSLIRRLSAMLSTSTKKTYHPDNKPSLFFLFFPTFYFSFFASSSNNSSERTAVRQQLLKIIFISHLFFLISLE